jgi:hypothetical protein
MITLRAVRNAVRLAVLGLLRMLLPGRALFRVLGIPAGTACLRDLQQIPVHEPTSKHIPPPRTVDETIHWKFRPGSDPYFRSSGWFFERSFVVPVRQGISRSTGVSFTPSGHVIDLGPGLTPPPSTYRLPYKPLSRIPHIDESVATLTTFWDSNYFHWLFDVLPRLYLVEQAGLKPRWIYASLRHAFQRDSLLRLGYGSDAILDAASVPHMSAAELIVPSLPGTPGVMPDWACTFLRERLAPATTTYEEDRQRVYISRAAARSRRIVNESALESLLASYGFTTVRLETMSFADQVRLFQSARCIVAPHGAGLANLVFCHGGASVVEIHPPGRMNVCYWLLSQQASLAYHYVLGSVEGPRNDVEVDVDKLEQTLETALHSSAPARDSAARSLCP